MRRRFSAAASVAAFALSGACVFAAAPASAQPPPAQDAAPKRAPVQDPASASQAPTQAPATETAVPPATAGEPAVAVPAPPADSASQVDIFSKNTLSVLLDARLVVADGATSFVNGGFGKTRFQGDSKGDFRAQAVPVEADVIWQPRFGEALTANVSAAYQRDHENGFDLIEAFVNYLPRQTGRFGFSARAGLMWPEISLEHSTGGAWSVVNTITPSAINSWVGEETKVIGVEATLHASFGQHDLLATGGVFGFNDTSGTLLSYRGWALHDIKATAFGHFDLPPLNPFITLLQQDETRSTVEIDKRVGFYGRLDWRPPWPFGVALFYYDNEGDPEAFYSSGQWGWRTRFLNLSFNADLGPGTRLLAQGMTGSTIMGFQENGVNWVHTDFNAAYALVTHSFGRIAVTGRVDVFDTREHGSEMPPDNSENGWAMTAAARVNLTSRLTMFAEAMNVRSTRGTRVDFGYVSPFEAQTVFQLAFRFRL
jgi:hypothetical protein